MRVDAHQHFWNYHPSEYGWIDPAWNVLRRDFLPADLLPELTRHKLNGSIAVQARQSLEETGWLLKLADENKSILGVIGWVDLCSPLVHVQLQEFSKHSKFRGVRHVIHDEPDDDFMLRDDFRHGIGCLEEFKLPYDLLIFPRHLANTVRFVNEFPGQVFVLDHIAKPDIRHKVLSPWCDGIRELASFPNVYCKISGMVTEAKWNGWHPDDFNAYLNVVLEAFGPDRLIFGSDWPVCLLAASYTGVLQLVTDYFRNLSSAQQENILGGNATRVYSLGS
jgi:L-fuconolactonase